MLVEIPICYSIRETILRLITDFCLGLTHCNDTCDYPGTHICVVDEEEGTICKCSPGYSGETCAGEKYIKSVLGSSRVFSHNVRLLGVDRAKIGSKV